MDLLTSIALQVTQVSIPALRWTDEQTDPAADRQLDGQIDNPRCVITSCPPQQYWQWVEGCEEQNFHQSLNEF